jgi:uncharacterized membrane protein YphA (DoxX/SURF4 family)
LAVFASLREILFSLSQRRKDRQRSQRKATSPKVVSKYHKNRGFREKRDTLSFYQARFGAWNEEGRLRHVFSAFPGGVSGVSLLVLRGVLGMAILAEGTCYIRDPNASVAAWCLGLSALAAGGLLVLGLFTPFVGIVAGLGAGCVALSLLPVCTPNVFDSKAAFIFALTMIFTVIGAGPGRYSVDARMFGRREIIIPPRHFQSEP